MKKSYLTAIIIIICSNIIAQKHDNIWLLGYGSYPVFPDYGGTLINFEHHPFEIYKELRDMDFRMTNSSMSDESGSLLFYTNGIYIANSEDNLMTNGDNLTPGYFAEEWADSGYRSAQGTLTLPHPGNIDQYYLFHESLEWPDSFFFTLHSRFLYYSLIDMSLENGLGAVIDKNHLILEDTLSTGELTAVKHANGRDWWILDSEFNSNGYYRFLLTENGVQSEGIQEIGLPTPGPGLGQAVFSPDGSKFVRLNLIDINLPQYINIYDFDRCSGLLSNHIQLTYADSAWAGGVAISPNSKYLYVSSFKYVYQYDLEAPDIAATKITIAEWDGFFSPEPPLATTFFLAQLASNGKIYINSNNSVQHMHVIHQPNKGGFACELEQHGLMLPTLNAFSMPNFPNYRLGPLDGSPCDTLGLDNLPLADFTWEADTLQPQIIEFTDNSFYEPAEWFWEFDDGATSTAINPVHEYSEIGVYNVCLTVSNQYDSDTKCREVEVDQVVGTGETAQANIFFAVSPNPASEWLQLQWRFSSRAPALWRLFDAFGQEVVTQRLLARQGLEVIYLDNLESGIYFWEVVQDGRKVESGKVVIVE